MVKKGFCFCLYMNNITACLYADGKKCITENIKGSLDRRNNSWTRERGPGFLSISEVDGLYRGCSWMIHNKSTIECSICRL